MNCETCQLKELVRFRSHPLHQFPSVVSIPFWSLILTVFFFFFTVYWTAGAGANGDQGCAAM
jgi:hypothetical protein